MKGATSWLRKVNWWLLLGGPIMLGSMTVAGMLGWIPPDLDAWMDEIAPFVLIIAGLIYWARAIYTRNPLYVILAVMVAALLCREIHFEGTDKGVYVAVAIIAVWCVAWRDLLAEPARDWRHTSWLIATAGMYAVSIMVSQRAFRHILPNEKTLHSKMEEVLEICSHAMFFLTSLVGTWRRYAWPGGRGAAGKTEQNNAPATTD